MTEAISNVDVYRNGMNKTMDDKLWFFDKIKSGIIIDFGCFDGELIKRMRELHPEKTYVGFDNSPEIIEKAKKNCPETLYMSDIQELTKFVTTLNNGRIDICLVANSVIHEVYSYDFVEKFLGFATCGIFKEIAIRDMALDFGAFRRTNQDDYHKLLYAFYQDRFFMEQVQDFRRAWGSLSLNHNFVHFLMKYRYVENWKRECQENYFPVTVDILKEYFERPEYAQYENKYFEHYTLPFHKEIIKKNFDINFDEKTHVKMLFERVENV